MKQTLLELAGTMEHDYAAETDDVRHNGKLMNVLDDQSEWIFTFDGRCDRCKLEKWAREKVLRGEEEREELSKKLQATEDERERMEIIAAMLAIAKVRRELVGDER